MFRGGSRETGTPIASVELVLSQSRVRLGGFGEDLACRELRRRGYAIVARRYRTRVGELDIVARDGGTLVFVEVKARRTTRFGGAAEAVTGAKRRTLWAMAEQYLARHRAGEVPCRFDVVTVLFGEGRPLVEVIRGAFSGPEP